MTQQVQFSEVAPPSGGPWGGELLISVFEDKIMKPLFPAAVWNEYIADDFEVDRLNYQVSHIKKALNAFDGAVEVHFSLDLEIFDGKIDQQAMQTIGVRFARGKRRVIVIPPALLEQIFTVVLDPLKAHLDQKLKTANPLPKFAFLVGGMGSNKYVKTQLELWCSNGHGIYLYTTPDASLAIVRGAVRFGLDSTCFGRKARTHYCLELYNEADPKNPLLEYIVKKDSVLSELARKSQKTPFGPYSPVEESQTAVCFSLYETADDDLKYSTDPRCILVGSITIDVSHTDSAGNHVPLADRDYYVTLSMDGTVITGTVKNGVTDETKELKWSSR
jgi:hypothetical protein